MVTLLIAAAWIAAYAATVAAARYRANVGTLAGQLAHSQAAVAALHAERDKASPLRHDYIGRVVMVTDDTDRTGYRGILVKSYFKPDGDVECVVLERVEEFKKQPDGRMATTAVPGDVVIPGRKIRVVQVVNDGD